MPKREDIMLCYPLEERRLPESGWQNAWQSWPVLVQPKLDGGRCRSIPFTLSPTLLSSEKNEFHTVPHINRALIGQGLGHLELDGELYCHGMNFNEIHSRCSTSRLQPHEDHKAIQFHVFDIVSDQPQYVRSKKLIDLALKFPLSTVPTLVVDSKEQLFEVYETYLDQDYEGIIVRNTDAPYLRRRVPWVMKFKPKKDDIYPIIGWKEEVSIEGVPKGRLGALICDDKCGGEFSVGSGLTDVQRSKYWFERYSLPGKLCKVGYQHLNPSGAPRFVTFIEVLEADNSNVNPLLDL